MAAWPGGLPLPQRKGYSIKETARTLRTTMETGDIREMLLSKNPRMDGTFTFLMTNAQASTLFWPFYDTTIGRGTEWISGFPLDTGYGIYNHTVRMKVKMHRPVGVTHQEIAVSLEVEDKVSA